MSHRARAFLVPFLLIAALPASQARPSGTARSPRAQEESDPVRAGEAALERGDCAQALAELLRALEEDEADERALRAIARVLHDPRHVADEAGERGRAILRRHPERATATLVPDGEPGEPMVVSGTLRDAQGHPIAGALLFVFQTDAQGHYTPTRVMDEPHARLFAFVTSGEDGRFELRTIRPGGYPGSPDRQGVEWEIPAHVHFQITGEGLRPRSFQLVFADDPRMQPARWREWAVEGRHPVATVERDAGDAGGVQRCTLEVELERSGP